MLFLNKHYGHLIRILHWGNDQAMTQTLAGMDLTAAQGHIMGYLSRRQTPPCSRDIEEKFHLSHPTVSGLLSRLEKKGFISLRPDPQDRRCKRIYIQPKGVECHAQIHQAILANEARMVEGFTPAEKAQFTQFLERAIANIGVQPGEHTPKEETSE